MKYKDYGCEKTYRAVNNKVRKTIRDAKEAFMEAKGKEVQQVFENTNTKLEFELVKQKTSKMTTYAD